MISLEIIQLIQIQSFFSIGDDNMNVSSVFAGKQKTSDFINEKGDLFTFGRNFESELGYYCGTNSDKSSILIPEKVTDNVKSVSIGRTHSILLKTNGDVETLDLMNMVPLDKTEL